MRRAGFGRPGHSHADIRAAERLGGRYSVRRIKDLEALAGRKRVRPRSSENCEATALPNGAGGHFRKERDMKTFINMLNDEAGASAAEYALILAVIGSVIAIAALGLAGAVGGAMDDASTCIATPTSANC